MESAVLEARDLRLDYFKSYGNNMLGIPFKISLSPYLYIGPYFLQAA